MNKTLATFLGFQKPAATVVVVNNAQSSATEETTTAETPTTEGSTTEETTVEESTEAVATTEATTTETAQAGEIVSISQAELTRLQAAATELAEMKPKYEILDTWYQNVKGESADLGQDASGTVEKKSWEKAPWNN